MSLPSRGRGLKLPDPIDTLQITSVAPFTGAWIEIILSIFEERLNKRRSLHGGVD